MNKHDTPIRVDHVGIAVESIENAEPVLFALGCERLTVESVEDRFRWAYYSLGDASRLELIEPIADDTFLTDFLDQYGPGLHHVTLEVADIDAVIESLRENDIRVIDRAEFDTWSEAFVSPRNPTGTLFQLMKYHDDYHEKRLPPQELFINESRVGEQFQR
ncbi:VOC family protein [Haladaptatus sp. DFWS20]|uniref:VOC family protein n=1 Tax=Haladaptatus sp. DFWS20 TaxID=3403467 RepID=UPI003EBDECC2